MLRLEASEYKCPNCGADLKFDPALQKLACEYCDSSFSMEEIKKIYAELEALPADEAVEEAKDEFAEHTNLYYCSSCGAEIMADDEQTALFCYYCHNPVILSGKLTGDYKPNKVIGFRYTREQALDAFKAWCKGRKFVPSDFKSQQQLEKMTGLYVPFWVADCDVEANYQAVGKKVRTWTSGEYVYTETKEYRIVRNARILTKGIPADGESKIDDLLMEAIEPFDYKDMKDFSMSYLSGFYADKYDVDRAGVFPRIRERADKVSREQVHNSIAKGYSSIKVNVENYNILKTDWSYMMLPVWFMSYKYNGKVYEFAMNGQTGKLAGTPPLSKPKLAAFTSGIGFIAFLIFFIGGLLIL
ncbi:MAG: hypothetical protein Q4A05_03940 [Ruminococcus sp.]|nr:hypothetical protein [Ruminococcus sp.]